MTKTLTVFVILLTSGLLSGCFKGDPDMDRAIAEIDDFYDAFDPDFEPTDSEYHISAWHEDVRGGKYAVINHSAYLLRSEKEIRDRNYSHLGMLHRYALALEHPPSRQVGDTVRIQFKATFYHHDGEWRFSHLDHSVFY